MILLALQSGGSSMLHAQEEMPRRSWIDSLETLAHYVLEHMSQYAPLEMRQELRERNAFHRKCYCDILSQTVTRDALGGIFAYLRTKLQLEYSIEHKTYWIVSPDPDHRIPGIAFPDSVAFPVDPWIRGWWSTSGPSRIRRR